MGQCEFAFFAFLCQDVAFKRMLSFNLSGTGKLKTLFGTGFCFLFRHVSYFLFIISLYFKFFLAHKPTAVRFCVSLFFLRGNEHNHPFAFQFGHLLHFSEFFQIARKTQKQDFTLIFVNNGTALEENVRLQFGAFLQKLFAVFLLEFIIVIVGIRPKPNFLNGNLGGFCL
jgi:hypothetical protein